MASDHADDPLTPPQPSQPAVTATKVAVMIPSNATLSQGLVKWCFAQAADFPAVTLSIVQHRASGFVEDVRQAMVDLFLQRSAAPWLLMVDDDTTPRLSAMQIAQGAEAAGLQATLGPTPFHPFRSGQRGVCANVFAKDASGRDHSVLWHKMPWQQRERYWPITSGGLACTLLSRALLLRLIDSAKKGQAEWPFRALWRNGRLISSEDITFWARVAKLGVTPYCDLDNPCIHEKRFPLTPQHAADDLPFHEPGASPHPQAPRSIPDGWRSGEAGASDVEIARAIVGSAAPANGGSGTSVPRTGL